MMTTFTLSNLPKECWIFEKNTYRLRNIVADISSHLPYVGLEYERILKSNSIPYRKVLKDTIYSMGENTSTTVCEYWNPEYFNEEEVTFPLFAKVSNGFIYCEKFYTEKWPTNATIEAAMRTKEFVEEEINKYEEILRQVKHYQFCKHKLGEKAVIACISTNTPYHYIYDIIMNYDNFKIIRIPSHFGYSDWVVIFDMNKVPKNGYLSLEVPKHIAGLVIGTGGSRIKDLAKEIRVKKIQVVPF